MKVLVVPGQHRHLLGDCQSSQEVCCCGVRAGGVVPTPQHLGPCYLSKKVDVEQFCFFLTLFVNMSILKCF